MRAQLNSSMLVIDDGLLETTISLRRKLRRSTEDPQHLQQDFKSSCQTMHGGKDKKTVHSCGVML